MLTKILPDQIASNWDVIGYSVQQSLPSQVEDVEGILSNVLMALLSGNMDCWVISSKDNKIEGIATTQILWDEASRVKTLLVYSVYSYGNISEQNWNKCLGTIREFAKNRGCHKISAFSGNERLVNLMTKLGADKQFFITFSL